MTHNPSCMQLKLVRYNTSSTSHDSPSFSEAGVDKQSGSQLDTCRIYIPLRQHHCLGGHMGMGNVFELSLLYIYKAL